MAKPKFPKKPNGDTALPTADVTSATPAQQKTVEASQPEATRSARKPSIVRSETRTNIVPISVDEEIRRLAYLMSERRGFEPGHETEDWLTAEHEIRLRYRQHSA